MYELMEIALFCCGIFLATTGAVLASGRLPLSAQPAGRRGWTNDLLVLAVMGCAVALALAALAFAWGRLNWPVAVVAGGLALLAAPPLLQVVPAHLADGRVGLGGQVVLSLTAILLISAGPQ